MYSYKLAWGGQCYTENYTIHSLLSMFFLLLFSVNPLFLIYSSLLHILTFHLYLTNLYSWHLSHFTSEEGGRRSLLSCDLHCSGYFLVNAGDKAVTHHLMRRQQATPNWKLPLLSLILSLQTILPTWNASKSFVSSPPLLGRISSLGTWYPHISTTTLQFRPRSSGTHNCHLK